MLRRLFSSGNDGSGHNLKLSSDSSQLFRLGSRSKGKRLLMNDDTSKENEGVIKRTMDEEQFASGIPKEHQGLKDKFESHKAGTLFKYAVITNKPSDERQGMLSKLRSFKPQTKVSNISLNDIPAIRLIGDYVQMNLGQTLSKSVRTNGEDFLLVDCILVHFVPLDSFANDKSVVTIQVNDFRKVTNTVTRVAKVDNTMGYNVLFFLDYCIEKRDASKISLSFTCSSKEFQEGVSWGTVKVVSQIQTLSFPRRMPLIGTMGVILLSDTDLDDFECDPREIDLVITPETLKKLRDANRRGEIENRTLPVSDKQELITAKTVLGDSYEEDDVGSVMSKMKEMAILKERQHSAKAANLKKLQSINENSSNIQGQASNSKKSRQNDSGISMMPPNGDYDQLKELEVGDSVSMQGDTQSEISQAFKDSKRGGIVKFAD
jgi:hypothetical protein